MTLQAVAHGRGMDSAFDVGGIFVGVAGQTESDGSSGDQLDSSNVAIDANFVTTGATEGDRGMDELALGFIFVAGDAGRGIGLGIKRDGMLGRGCAAGEQEHDKETGQRGQTPGAWSLSVFVRAWRWCCPGT